MGRPLWFVEIFKRSYRRREVLFKLISFPIVGKILKKFLFEDDAVICLPKDSSIQIPINESIEVDKTILPSKVVEYFIEKANFHWLMDFCICRDSNKCENYPRNLGCLFLGDAARGINKNLGRQVTKKEALEHLKKCREVGLVHSVGRSKFDTIWLGVGPGSKLLTICNCCECCCIAGGLKHVPRQIADEIFNKMAGVDVRVTNRCVGCKTCTKVCFLDAIHVVNKRAFIDQAICKGCGRCVEKCPKKAIAITINDEEFLKKSIERISSRVIV